MRKPRVKKQILVAYSSTGETVTIYVYRADGSLIDEGLEHEHEWTAEPVLITIDGEPVERKTQGVYYLTISNIVVTSSDPNAP